MTVVYSLVDAVERIQYHAGRVPGVKTAPVYPPETMSQFPFVVTYPARGVWNLRFDTMEGIHTVFTEFHVARGGLVNALRQAYPLHEPFINNLNGDYTLNGTVDTLFAGDPIIYSFGRLEWAGSNNQAEIHIGWRFEFRFKQISSV